MGNGDKQLHHGHRDRMRERAEQGGLDGFADHEVLELLLFAIIPRANTNPIAHRLLKRFGNLSAVLEADPKDLAGVDGIGTKGGMFLAQIPHIARRYMHDRIVRDNPALTSPDAVSQYLIPLMASRAQEVVYLLCLDAQFKVRFAALISEGTVAEAHVHRRHVIQEALRHQAVSVILAHNHPAGSTEPSVADRHLTQRIHAALAAVDIPMLDHVIVAGEKTFSFQQNGMMPVTE
jgi:DNA repair protein RadC